MIGKSPMPAILLPLVPEAWRLFEARTIPEAGRAAVKGAGAALSIYVLDDDDAEQTESAMNGVIARVASKDQQLATAMMAALFERGAVEMGRLADEALDKVVQRFTDSRGAKT